ncbi:MAG: TIGR02099 family protein [Oleispira sp.]|nr:TIGR02099 family protein [Oleispira sp.]
MKRCLHLIWSQLWLTGVVGLVLLALYTSLGRQLIPLVETLNDDVEKILSAQLNLPVTIGSLEGDWIWFSPAINVNNITLGESDNQLHAKRLEAVLDVSASLFYRSLVFKKITLNGVELSVYQDETLTWKIGQFSLSNNDTAVPNPESNTEKPLWLELLTQQGELHLLNWQVDVKPFAEESERIELIDLRLRNKGQQHWLDGEVRLGGKTGAILKTQFEVEGDLWELAESNGRGYVELEPREWKSWFPIKDKSIELKKLVVGGKVWVELEQGLLHSLDGYIDVPQYEIFKQGQDYQQSLAFKNGRITLAGRRDELNWHLWFNSDAQWLSKLTASLPKGRLSYLAGLAGGWQLVIKDLDLESSANLIEDFELLPLAYIDYVANLQPQGLAKKIHINLIPEQDWRWGVKVDLVDTSIIAWNGIPTLEGINASIELNANKGLVSIRNNDTLLHFPDLYPEGWQLSQLSSQVFWQVADEYLRLVGPTLNAKLAGYSVDQAAIGGGFSLYLPLNKSKFEPQLNLSLGFKHIPILAQQKFLPPNASPSLSDWLNYNIHTGEIKEGTFLYAGFIGPDVPQEALTMQLYLDIENASLNYLSGWPRVSNIKAKLMLDSPTVNIWLHSAKTLGGDLVANTGRIRVRNDENDISWLTVKGEVEGSAQEGLEYLQTTPLREDLDGAFDEWTAKGRQTTKLYARIPLTQPEEIPLVDNLLQTKIRLSSDLHKVDLSINDLDLNFKKVVGQLEFDSETGISSKKLVANIFGGEVIASIHSENINDKFEINVSAVGKAESESIKLWQPLFLLKTVEGDLSYQIDFDLKPINRGGVTLVLSSDLVGMTINTPVPFGKTAEEKIPFKLSIKNARDTRFSFTYGDWANGVMTIERGVPKRGQIYLGTTQAYLPSDDGLRINGHLPVEIDAQAWWELWEEIKPAEDVPVSANEGEAIAADQSKASLLTHVDISAAKVNAWQQPMGLSHVVGDYSWGQWQFQLTSDLIKGEIILRDDEPILLELDYIHMPVSDVAPTDVIKFGASNTHDNLQNVDPNLIPAMDLKVEEIFLGTSNFGRWDLTVRQKSDYTQIHINDSLTKALKVQGNINWSKKEGEHKTHLELLRISSKNLGDSQRAFRKAAAIESKKSRFDIDMTWSGSPVKFNYATLNGLAKISIKDGVLVSDNAGALKAFGILNFNTISRRLKLDFSDLYEAGVVFDSLKARMSFENGVATLVDPLVVTSPSAKFQSTGSIDFNNETVDQKLIVTFPIGSSLPLVAVLAGLAPTIAGAIYVTEKLIGEELEKFTSASYTVTGSIENPELKINQAFDNDLEGKETRSFSNRVLDIFGLGDDE